MNSKNKSLTEGFVKFLKELKISKPEHLFELEDRVITEISKISITHSAEDARSVILELKEHIFIFSEFKTEPHIKPLLKSFFNSIEGAVSTALCCL
ncbi:hypothetical protein A3J90_00375 [candidate division WOR-1 bacterium RIFOXYC2_FULL_37_10]|uniref:Uncharacterized protein n=1 Tax=candidate division WOR-1 bacterium RIFOXYB2_FULL_37_13 TaxID=1802579 RepID=A0A1F4SMP2_UNCSA|nr:MAG: hypothetical protein A2246_02975 [candidate division WOR-1 bacterium RIFOXYA2_FULL_37_7]OGC21724.1 MAG: hypothetical protein A2310_00260 [candidate division WOR-1 bacterium RIFOXYB2_FULL_37_13]OGC32587.1 MAG: hypothetical protein A3J90_00375 [candidate division WOR-1 bacterium RIFOXYC2_FULL_37_10]